MDEDEPVALPNEERDITEGSFQDPNLATTGGTTDVTTTRSDQALEDKGDRTATEAMDPIAVAADPLVVDTDPEDVEDEVEQEGTTGSTTSLKPLGPSLKPQLDNKKTRVSLRCWLR